LLVFGAILNKKYRHVYLKVAGMPSRIPRERVLKNGYEMEALQLSSIDRLERALALFMVVAWRVTHLMRKGPRTSTRVCSSIPMKYAAPIC
jgi:hypothetical protein